MSTVRTRIPPSPTGPPHVGTAYVALFSIAFARKHGGKVVLRIEDTDQRRSRPEHERAIMEGLRWLGLTWDEGPDMGGPNGPYRQSERGEIYREHVETLISSGHAYPCFCTAERLEKMRQEQKKQGQNFGYDGLCRQLTPEEAQTRRKSGESHVVRLKMPRQGMTVVPDLLRSTNPPSFQNETMDDQVLLKSDGMPTYHLANVVDDHLMGISHVIRAEEWISSTPKHLVLYEAFGWKIPVFCHLPLLRNQDKSKISKRRNPTSLEFYRRAGFLPEALLNFLALMGWTMPDGSEVFSFDQFCEVFELDQVTLGGPVFNMDKLRWLNGKYIREVLSPEELLKRVSGMDCLQSEYLERLLPMARERMETLSEFFQVAHPFLVDRVHPELSDLIPKKGNKKDTLKALKATLKLLASTDPWTREKLETELRAQAESMQCKTGDLFMPIRVSVSGSRQSPPLFEMMEALGRDLCLQRLREAMDRLHAWRPPT